MDHGIGPPLCHPGGQDMDPTHKNSAKVPVSRRNMSPRLVGGPWNRWFFGGPMVDFWYNPGQITDRVGGSSPTHLKNMNVKLDHLCR